MHRRTTKWDIAFNGSNFILLAAMTLMCLYPFYYIIIYSISDPVQALRGIAFLPRGFTLETYVKILQLEDISHAFFISITRTVIGSTVTVGCSTFFAYLVTRDDMPYRSLVYRIVIASTYLHAGMIPNYLLIKHIGLRDSFLVYIIPGLISAYFVILVKTYIESLPKSLEESAMIDGATTRQIFMSVIFPLCKPIVATISVFSVVGDWNSYMDNYLYVNNPNLNTIQLLLYKYMQQAQSFVSLSREDMENMTPGQYNITPETVRMTITVVVTLPIMFVYPFFQRFFVKGIMMGSVKG
ncbi:carbohydrate ABC transporter permease [Paenibacillus cymbidii]|uniref:carbohydrate ABC transporter permease n=1 Tax=Paenibacillus cymbidii TaxID=1639034 RepID=UPI001F16B81B|nr:carbohydrate ABC transporter permease [Paenibacillus cymbidii]